MSRRAVARTAAVLSAVLAVAAAPHVARAADVALRNARFTAGSADAPTAWTSIAWARETVQFGWTPPGADGSGSAVIQNLAPNDARWCQSVDVEPGATYRVSARARTSDVGTATAGAHIGIERIADSTDLRGTQDWQPLDVTAHAGEETQWDVCMRLGSYSNLNTGTAWFTDVVVTQVTPPPARPGVIATAWAAAWEAARESDMYTAVPFVAAVLLAFGLGVIGRPRPRA